MNNRPTPLRGPTWPQFFAALLFGTKWIEQESDCCCHYRLFAKWGGVAFLLLTI